MKKILLVEDEPALTQTIKRIFAKEYEIESADNVQNAINLIETNDYDLYLLDLLLPDKTGRTGLDICKLIRAKDSRTPILVITGKTATNYKLGAFNIGADDYLTKPFSMLELRARIKNLLKRTEIPILETLEKQEGAEITNTLVLKELVIELASRKVSRKAKLMHLRKKEFDLLKYLVENQSIVLTREQILRKIWDKTDEISSNSLDVHIKNLRNKIDKGFKDKLIKTVYGVGYKIE